MEVVTSPKISIIIPVYNGGEYLAEAIQSVLAQSFTDYELIVVDDGSTDQTRAIVTQFQTEYDRIHLYSQENSGVAAARNRGVAVSRGALLAFLDQDDRWTADALEKQVAYHEQNPHIQYTLAHQICFLEAGHLRPAWFQLQKLDEPHIGHLPGTLVVKRPLFDTLGLFDTAYPISSDADWFARAKDADIPTATLPDVILQRRIHAANQSRHSSQIRGELFQLLRASIRRKKNVRPD